MGRIQQNNIQAGSLWYLAAVEENTIEIEEYLISQGMHTTYERNQGNHYQDAELRVLKGVKWTLEYCEACAISEKYMSLVVCVHFVLCFVYIFRTGDQLKGDQL